MDSPSRRLLSSGSVSAGPTSASPSPSNFGVRATRRPKPSRAVSSARSESSGSDGPAPIRTRRSTCSSPVILLADLDQGQVQSVTRSKRLSNYPRCLWVDLDWLLRGGAGNVPQAAQYMTRVALKVPYESLQDIDSQPFTSWKTTRSFFVDSAGAKENQTRLTFFLFSTGGGTGSGMSIEVGTAQGFLTHKRQKELTKAPSGNPGASLLAKTGPLEACCSIGLGIMPGRTQEIDAQALNTGRVLCNYLARFGRFASVFDRKELSEIDLAAIRRAAARLQ